MSKREKKEKHFFQGEKKKENNTKKQLKKQQKKSLLNQKRDRLRDFQNKKNGGVEIHGTNVKPQCCVAAGEFTVSWSRLVAWLFTWLVAMVLL